MPFAAICFGALFRFIGILTHSGIDAGQLLAQPIVWSALFSVVLVAVFRADPCAARCAAPPQNLAGVHLLRHLPSASTG